MMRKPFPSNRPSVIEVENSAVLGSLHKMYLYSIIGILAFFAIAWVLGDLKSSSYMPKTSATHVSSANFLSE